MLTGPWHDEMRTYPPRPPRPYTEKDSRNFKLSNNFSAHDNRHSFQDHGVYFGDGDMSRSLGKRSTASPLRQHGTDKDYLKHRGRVIVNHEYNTIYDSDFQGQATAEPPTRRRFPRQHKEGAPGLAKLTTSTTRWSEEASPELKTSTQVLAVSQEPFLPANHWKYSYHTNAPHALNKCYPPYDRPENKDLYPSWAQSTPACARNMPGDKMADINRMTPVLTT